MQLKGRSEEKTVYKKELEQDGDLGCQPPGYDDHLTSRVATHAFKVATDANLFDLFRILKAVALHHIKKKKNRLIKAKTKIIVYIIFMMKTDEKINKRKSM